jgi:hypothetical protein
MNSAINHLEIYREAMDIGEEIWMLASGWDFFAKDTVGKQIVRSSDSIAANQSEGYGRYHFQENQKFCYYPRVRERNPNMDRESRTTRSDRTRYRPPIV